MRLISVLMVAMVAMMVVGCDETGIEAEKASRPPVCVYDAMNTDGEEGICEAEMEGYQLARFERYDENDDTTVTVSEFHEAMGDDFAAADANDDEVVTVEEMVAWGGMNGVLHENQPAGDANGDGLLDRQELGATFAAMHRNADADKDGKVTREEFRRRTEVLFQNMDTDNNGTLSETEVCRIL
jgi:Ca2+-binding EF-hand superfamily protein